MNIQHESLFDTAKVEKLYTEKDGVEVKYVCTTDLKLHGYINQGVNLYTWICETFF